MTTIHLNIYREPGEVETYLQLKKKDGAFQALAATIDTGAAVSLLPISYLENLDVRQVNPDPFAIFQAGIANQTFEAVEGYVLLYLEDLSGQRTPEFEARFWFANTDVRLIGFADILDRAILHVDMPMQSGWLSIDP